MGGLSKQGKFKGTNKLCQQCIKECKQFENVKVMKCNFTSNQKRGDTLQARESNTLRGKDGVKQTKMANGYVGMGETLKDTLPLAESVKQGISKEVSNA
jgi:hypothetical protein